jgi:hypothetical protein
MKRMILLAALLSVLTFGLIAIENPAAASYGGRIPYCGDPCEAGDPGGGCVYYNISGNLVRARATCQNGYWTRTP